jgi:hypothetical protein
VSVEIGFLLVFDTEAPDELSEPFNVGLTFVLHDSLPVRKSLRL